MEDEQYYRGFNNEWPPPAMNEPGYDRYQLGQQHAAERAQAHAQRLARLRVSVSKSGQLMRERGVWFVLKAYLVYAVVLPVGCGVVVGLFAALLGGNVAHAFEVAWGVALGAWIIYGALLFGSYALVRYFRWLLLAGGIVVAILIFRAKT